MGDSNQEGEDQQSPHSQSDSVQPQMTMHPITYSGMPMHMYPFPHNIVPTQPPRTKRRQVKNACTNCQKACKKCDDARPCLRCVKYGIAEECVDSQRKERQKGIKRGPYKKRDGKTGNVEQQLDVSVQQGMAMPPAVAATSATPPVPYVAPIGYPPPGFYPQYPAAPTAKPGEPVYYQPHFFYAPVQAQPLPPGPHGAGQEGDASGYQQQTQYYPVFPAAHYQPYPGPYMMPRPDGQVPMSSSQPHYAPYPPPQAYAKPPSRGTDVGAQMIDSRRDGRLDMGRNDSMHGNHGKTG